MIYFAVKEKNDFPSFQPGGPKTEPSRILNSVLIFVKAEKLQNVYSQRASRMSAHLQIFIDQFILRFHSSKNLAILRTLDSIFETLILLFGIFLVTS